jgi:hypothetical protein
MDAESPYQLGTSTSKGRKVPVIRRETACDPNTIWIRVLRKAAVDRHSGSIGRRSIAGLLRAIRGLRPGPSRSRLRCEKSSPSKLDLSGRSSTRVRSSIPSSRRSDYSTRSAAGFTGGLTQVRMYAIQMRPRPAPEPAVPFKTELGSGAGGPRRVHLLLGQALRAPTGPRLLPPALGEALAARLHANSGTAATLS